MGNFCSRLWTVSFSRKTQLHAESEKVTEWVNECERERERERERGGGGGERGWLVPQKKQKNSVL